MAEGKKSRKFGRNAKRPSQVRYRSELRMEKNKRINIEKAAAFAKECANKVIKVARGAARRIRRRSIQCCIAA